MSLICRLHLKYCNSKTKTGGSYTFENYKILGKGGFGVVYEVNRDFVIKKFNDKRFWEMEKTAIESITDKMKHVLQYTLLENSIAIDPLSDEGGGMYLIQYPNSQGFTLTEYLSKLKNFGFNQINVTIKKKIYETLFLKTASSVLNVINQLTNVENLHCDIKLDNLMFSERDDNPNIRVIDFAGVTTFGQECKMKTGLYTRDGMLLQLSGHPYPSSFKDFLKDTYKIQEDIVRNIINSKIQKLYDRLYDAFNKSRGVMENLPQNVDDLFATGLVLCLIYVKEMDIKYLNFAINLLNLERPYTIQDALKDLEQLQLIQQS